MQSRLLFVSSTLLVCAFVLLAASGGITKLITYTYERDEYNVRSNGASHNMTSAATPTSNGFAALLAAPLANGSVAVAHNESGYHLATNEWGFFHFCYSLQLSLVDTSTGTNATVTSYAFPRRCATIDSSCGVDLSPLYVQLTNNAAFAPDSDLAAASETVVLYNCPAFNGARSMFAFSILGVAVSILCAVLLWRRKVPEYALTIATVTTAGVSLLTVGLTLNVYRNDRYFSALLSDAPMTSMPPAVTTMQFGAAYILLLTSTSVIALAMLCACVISYMVYARRTLRGSLFSLQENPESGILESHVNMYEQLEQM
jgi:hypothetical protein